MRERIRETAGKTMSWVYSFFMGGTDAIDTWQSIASVRDFLKLTPSSATTLGIVSSALSGAGSAAIAYNFQGKEIEKNTKRRDDDDSEESSSEDSSSEEDEDELIEKVTRLRQNIYLTTKYSLITATILQDFFEMGMLVSGGKAWMNGIIGLAAITPGEFAALVTYYVTIDIPIILFVELNETLNALRKRALIPKNQQPDQAFIDLLVPVAKLIGKNTYIRKGTRITSSIGDTIEHIAPMIFMIPPKRITQFQTQDLFVQLLVGSPVIMFTLVMTVAVFGNTYFFEGDFYEKNLLRFISEPVEKSTPWIHPKFAAVAHKLFYLMGPLHGVDLALAWYLTLQESEVNDFLTYAITAAGLGIGWFASHYSEVKHSQKELKKATLSDAETAAIIRQRGGPTLAAAQNYKSIGDDIELPSQFLKHEGR